MTSILRELVSSDKIQAGTPDGIRAEVLDYGRSLYAQRLSKASTTCMRAVWVRRIKEDRSCPQSFPCAFLCLFLKSRYSSPWFVLPSVTKHNPTCTAAEKNRATAQLAAFESDVQAME
jgi:hypothetical protein